MKPKKEMRTKRNMKPKYHMRAKKTMKPTIDMRSLLSVSGIQNQRWTTGLDESVQQRKEIPMQETKKTKGTPILVWLALLAAVSLLLILCSGPKPAAKATATPDAGDPLEACGWCQVEVKKELKAPASARFPSCNRAVIRKVAEGVYEVKSYVDAQNSFGATIRTAYVCRVRYRGDHLWTLQELAFGE